MRARLAIGVLALAGLVLLGAQAPAGYAWRLPHGVAPPPVPADNPMSAAKVELGRQLFYEADLSIDGTMSCATCHRQRHAFAEDNATHPGVDRSPGRRNVMALANVGYYPTLTWADPSLPTLERQARVPIVGEHPVEMGFAGKTSELTARLGADACYARLFAAAFPESGGEVTMDRVTMALASFQRTMVSFDAPYDRARRGQTRAMDDAGRRGQALFEGAALDCASCHAGPTLTDGAFHKIEARPGPDRGMAERSSDPADAFRFRTPTLRNAALTGPYLHDGSARTLTEAITRHQPANGKRAATQAETADLIAFLGALTDQRFVADKRFALPTHRCGKRL